MGPCAERPTRANAASMVQTAAFLLRNALSLHLLGANAGGAPPSAQLLAISALEFLKNATLPPCLLPWGFSDAELRNEFRERLRFVRSDGDRQAVEISRINLVKYRCAPPLLSGCWSSLRYGGSPCSLSQA